MDDDRISHVIDKKYIGRRIHEVRMKNNGLTGKPMTQEEFANLFNSTLPKGSVLYTTRNDIAKYEIGINEPSASKFLMFILLDPDYADEPKELVEARLKAEGFRGLR